MTSVKEIKSLIDQMGVKYSPGNSSKKGHLYNPLPFPEFNNVPSQREAVYERFEMIKPHVQGKTLLDVGCHTGFNCFMFEKEGFSCTGVELHQLTHEIASKVADLKEVDCTFINGSADIIPSLGKFDTCLFLSVFQWITKAEGFERAKELLSAAIDNSHVLFFETSMGAEGKAKMPMLSNPDSVYKMLSEFATVEYLGDVVAPGGVSHPRRCIFKCL